MGQQAHEDDILLATLLLEVWEQAEPGKWSAVLIAAAKEIAADPVRAQAALLRQATTALTLGLIAAEHMGQSMRDVLQQMALGQGPP